jgi:hypothetical protein
MNFRNVPMAEGRGTDHVVAGQVRAELGRVSSHPQVIDVQVNNGEVTLRGPVLNTEVMDILTGVESVSGVRAVRYELDGYESAEKMPSMHGTDGVGDEMTELRHHRWAPAARAAVTAGLVATGAWAVMRARA